MCWKDDQNNILGHVFRGGQSALKGYLEMVTENQGNGYRGVGGVQESTVTCAQETSRRDKVESKM